MTAPELPAEPSRSISSARTARARETKSGRLTLAESIAQQVDWNPTCLPGTEKAAIVRQILALDDVASDDDYWLRIDALADRAVPHTGLARARGELAAALAADPSLTWDELIYRAFQIRVGASRPREPRDTVQAHEPPPLRFAWTELLFDELSARGIPLRMLAKPLGLTVPEVEDLIAGERELSGDLAARIGQFLGTSTRLWLNLAAQGPSRDTAQAPRCSDCR